METKRGIRKFLDGIVVSNKMQKTVVVRVSRRFKHSVYGKYIRRTNKFYAHDPGSLCQVGDTVRIVSTRPLSHLKRWQVQKVLVKNVE